MRPEGPAFHRRRGEEGAMELKEYLPFWDQLSAPQRQQLAESATERALAPGQLLTAGSAGCVGLLVVLEGRLRAYVLSEEGKELTLYRLYPRDICLFSASCVLRSIQFEVMVSVESAARVVHIPAEVYRRLMEQSAPVANYTNELMATRFSDVMWLMDQVMNKKLDARLAALLLEERALAGTPQLALTHDQLARHLGSAREVVTRMLKYFQGEGLVQLGRGSLTLRNERALAHLAGESLR